MVSALQIPSFKFIANVIKERLIMTRKTLCLFVATALFVSGGLFAQNAQDLRFGSVLSGNLSSEQEIWYRITAAETCLVIVETLGNTDTYLEAYDAQRNLIIADDDGGGDNNAKVEFFAARGSSYLVKLTAYGYTSGPYRILASSTPVPAATTLGIGSVLAGSIASGQSYWYSVQTRETGFLTVETTSGIDTYLEAYNSSYALITADDDGGEGSNARIDIPVQANQTYYFRLRGYSSGDTGSYRILSSIAPMPSATTLGVGSVVAGNISSGGNYWYSVQTREAGLLIVETIGSTDTYLEAYNSTYAQIAYNDDGGENNNARIEIPVQANQTYYFRLRGFGGESGPYRILASIERIEG